MRAPYNIISVSVYTLGSVLIAPCIGQQQVTRININKRARASRFLCPTRTRYVRQQRQIQISYIKIGASTNETQLWLSIRLTAPEIHGWQISGFMDEAMRTATTIATIIMYVVCVRIRMERMGCDAYIILFSFFLLLDFDTRDVNWIQQQRIMNKVEYGKKLGIAKTRRELLLPTIPK